MPRRRRTTAAISLAVAASLVAPLEGAASTTAGAAPRPNLIVNPTFESGTGNWYTGKGTSFTQGTGHTGQGARLTAGASGAVTLNDGPDTVRTTQQGATYSASAYVRSSAPGKRVVLRMQEFLGAASYGSGSTAQVLPDTGWQRVEVSYTARTTDSRLGLTVSVEGLPAGQHADVDDVSMTSDATRPMITAFSATPGQQAHSSVDLSWAATDAVRYELVVAGTSSPVWTGTTSGATVPAAAATTYGFTLQAIGAFGDVVSSEPVTVRTAEVPPTWSRVYRHDFKDLVAVNRFQTSVDANSALLPSDTSNSTLQKPTLRSNVQVVTDSAADGGTALAVWTRPSTYQTAKGAVTGWTNGRMSISGHDEAPPVRIRTRVRMTASANAKTAVMWWPQGGGWPWEVDFAETFGGASTTDYWGGRQHVSQRWHADLDGDGQALEQLVHDVEVDATQYHVYDLFITPQRMWIEIDGVRRYETTDSRFIPKGKGFFTIGKGLTHRRDASTRTKDGVFVDWLEIYRPVA